MTTISRFEDIVAWQRARELTALVYKAFRSCKDYGFTDQIQRASVSVMSNIAEGFESGTREMFVRYLFIAKGSAGEVRAQLYAAYDIGHINAETFKNLKSKAEECSKLISSFVPTIKTSPHDGLQRKRELTKEERDAEEFHAYAQAELAKIHPNIFGKKK